MKHLAILLSLITFHFSLFTLSASAAVPLKWTVETSRATPAQFEAYQGETLALEASLQSYGKPLEAPLNYSLYWQTNGMGNAWWSAPCTVPSAPSPTGAGTNVLFATWSPTNDVGAKVYNCFIGKPGTIHHAAFQLRLRPSPGATPNELPLPQKVIDFAKVTVLNPPWSGGGGVDTNAVRDIIHATVDGSARPLPPYLHYLEMDDTYPEEAAEWYAQADYSHGSCSARRTGGLLERNYDWNFDFMPEFIIRTVAASATGAGQPVRFASLAVCNVGTNLTEADVTSGKHLRWLKALPGHAVDGINSEGVVAEVNVVSTNGVENWHGDPAADGIHCLGAIRWVLDHATNAQHGAEVLAERVYVPAGYGNFHYMIADASETWIVENGESHLFTGATGVPPVAVMTNFRLYPSRDTTGEGQERYDALASGASITSQWWAIAYTPSGYRASDLQGLDTNLLFRAWAETPKEQHRGETFGGQSWWQTLHTSVYDINNKTLRICVQETDDWYVFSLPGATGVSPVAVREIVEPMIGAATNGIPEDVAALQDGKLDKTGGTITRGPYEPVYFIVNPDYSGMTVKFGEFSFTDTDVADSSKFSVGDFKLETVLTDDGWTGAMKMSLDGEGASISVNGTNVMSELSKKRDLTDNTCHKTEFTEWSFSGDDVPPDTSRLRVFFDPLEDRWQVWIGHEEQLGVSAMGHTPNDLTVSFYEDGAAIIAYITATRTAVCTSNELYTTKGYVDGSISTNNPAFVSAVRAVSPPPSPNLRLYDDVRRCWWIGRMVNGVINWEVE